MSPHDGAALAVFEPAIIRVRRFHPRFAPLGDANMMRSVFFAAGAFIAMWGITFTVVDSIVFVKRPESAAIKAMFKEETIGESKRDILDPPDWMPFSLLAIGGVTMLYAFALPKLVRPE
jgi:hypothetical protein